ncbi:MAG TPA: CDP-diacylglycerol--glycerol-3-phosphate 3-phosphatidyltransferase [Ktedonobacterales bacterium]
MQQMPNVLSLGRMVLTIPVVVLILIDRSEAYLAATVLFAVAAVSDGLDGRLARKYHVVSNMGVFLDLTADKVFVGAILIALVQVGLVPAWIPIIVVSREFVVSGLRSMAAARSVIIPAGPLGKQKTLLTLVAIGGILLARGLGGSTAFPLGLSTGGAPHDGADYLLALADGVLILAVIWTILSSIDYLRAAWGLVMTPAAEEPST